MWIVITRYKRTRKFHSEGVRYMALLPLLPKGSARFLDQRTFQTSRFKRSNDL